MPIPGAVSHLGSLLAEPTKRYPRQDTPSARVMELANEDVKALACVLQTDEVGGTSLQRGRLRSSTLCGGVSCGEFALIRRGK
jgi:hypothetical protein